MKYFIYCRKSSEAEDRQVLSIESQLSTLQRAFGDRPEIEVIGVYEEAFSAKSPGRKQFSEMMSRIERGDADGIIAWAPDRLARNSIDGGRIVYSLDCGTVRDLKFATYTFENNPQGKFMLQIMFGQSKYYSDALSENVKRGNRTKVEKGWRPNQPPLGYLNDKSTRTIVPDPERFHLVRKMFDLMLTGAYSPRDIWRTARDELGVRTIKRKRIGGKPLALGAIYKILTNPFYAGVLVWVGKTYPGAHEPMISLDELRRIRALLGRREKPKPKTKEFAFTGMIRCGECGLLVTAETKINAYGSTYTYYHCSKRRLDVRCSQRSLREEVLEQQICEFLARLFVGPRLAAWAVTYLRESKTDKIELQKQQLQALEKAVAETDRTRVNLTSMRLKDFLSDEEFLRERRNLDEEHIRIKRQIESVRGSKSTLELDDDLILACNRAVDWFLAADTRKKRILVNLVGSNFFLKDKKLFVEAKKPFRLLADTGQILKLRAALENIRILHRNRDPELLKILEGLREFKTSLDNPSIEADRLAP